MRKKNTPGCPCCEEPPPTVALGICCPHVPTTIVMHVAHPIVIFNNFVFAATFVYGTKPAALAIYPGLPDPGFYSTTSFAASTGLFKFWYHLRCDPTAGIIHTLAYMIATSPLGYPGLIFLSQWLPGTPGNVCSPFAMLTDQSTNPTIRGMGVTLTP